jgi:membrane protein DedA with SNARE-associated domain
MDLLPALGLLGLLFVKEAGVPVPVPGDLLVIGAGVAAAAAGGGAAAVALLAAILVAGYAGGSLQFALVRGAFRAPLLAILRRAGISEERIEQLAAWLRRRGATGVATARATPGIRVGAIAASGLAALRFGPFLGGLVVGNGVFVGAHFLLGAVVGPPALAAVSASSGPIVVAAALAVLALLGAGGWLALRRRRRAASSAERPDAGAATVPAALGLMDGLGAWADAACPACLAVELVRGGSR